MDISKEGSKGICVTKMSTILLLLIITPMLLCASDSFHIEDIECICSGTSAVCSGISNDEDEIQELLSQLLQNCSSTNDLLDLTLNIENLDHLPEYPFAAFKLQNLTLGYGLSVLNSNAFDGLNSSLLSLNLSHNDIEFFGTPLSVLENLKELNLDFNNLREDDVSAFGNLNKLEVLSISGNNLTGLNANFFENMTAIQTLILDHNENITSFLNISIISSTLITLSAKNCSIKGSLESDSLSGIANLKHADFSSNNLIRVNAFALDRLHYLETLKLSNNKIETLKNYSFSSLHNLLVLDLKGNVIKEIEEFSFVNLTKLEILDLSENKLEVFMEKYTSDLHSLEKISLEDNQIHVIMPGSFSTCGQLKELLLQGNAFHCDICEVKYIVGFLTNDTLFKKEDADAVRCAAPAEMKDTPLTEVPSDVLDEMCEDEDESTYETEDDSTYETPITIISTTEKTTTATDFTLASSTSTVVAVSNSSFYHTDDPLSTDISTQSEENNTNSVISTIPPQNTSESTDTTYETTASFITNSTTKPIIPGATDPTTEVTTLISESTTGVKEAIVSLSSTELSSVSFSESEATEKTETNATTEVVTLSMPETTTAKETITERTSVSTDATSESEITETNATTEVINISISEHTTAGNVGTSAENTSELPTTSTTEKETIIRNTTEITTSTSKLTSTLLPGIDETITSTTITQSSTTSTNITTESPTVSTSKTDLNTEETSQFNTIGSTQADFASTDTLFYSESTKAFATTALPKKKISDSQMIRIIDYSVSDDKICIRWDMKWEILREQWIINDLKCGVEIQHSRGKQVGHFKNCPTSEHEIQECAVIENKYLNNMYKFCLNVYISIFKKLRSCSKYEKILNTTEKPFKHSSTTDLSTLKSLPPTQGTFVPFKVVKFDASFNYSKSFVDVKWVVNRNERNSICSLNLILLSHNFNYTEGVFSCKNNSYKIQNIKHEAFQVCLRNFYQGYYAPLLCESSVPLSYEFKASRMKDDGYKNSAVIAVICLLILIVLIIIVILLKKILKKRTESDLYNVSAEERNVLRRQASAPFQQEPCVRYSYTLKEQIEI
ncbi:Leucine-rich repeats and immunoglobulin-like domains protein 1 [Araneus ventricosus]|uniref:Leucine-rich repeats and immunoglobulin-like domains protein 1 n=1 Tax=Araneus ventricosus TaxID=182803 RepID=A0A4Y2L6H1_ARAVE|nr:Leucine-rich repeats and immunoglobulin-like domains protein 1 [Araneus ventricosus]